MLSCKLFQAQFASFLEVLILMVLPALLFRLCLIFHFRRKYVTSEFFCLFPSLFSILKIILWKLAQNQLFLFGKKTSCRWLFSDVWIWWCILTTKLDFLDDSVRRRSLLENFFPWLAYLNISNCSELLSASRSWSKGKGYKKPLSW